MNYIRGSAIKLQSEVDVVLNTVVTFDVYNPSGTKIESALATSFSTVNTSIAFAVWQSTTGLTAGRYKFIAKAVNGARTNYAEGLFYLEEI